MGVTQTIQLQITMRCAIFLAIACVAMSAPTTEENFQAEEVNPLTSEVNPLTSEVSGQEIVEAYQPVNKNTEDALATNGRKLLGSSGRRCSRRGNLIGWGGGRKRIGRHLYGQRLLYTWRCNRYQYRRWWWALLRRNAYSHRLHVVFSGGGRITTNASVPTGTATRLCSAIIRVAGGGLVASGACTGATPTTGDTA